MNKQKLYESIMTNVAKQVKKAILETYDYVPPKFIDDEIIDNTQLNKMAIKFVKDTDMQKYKQTVKLICGEYVNDNKLCKSIQHDLAKAIYKKLKHISVYDLDKISKVSPAHNNIIEAAANEYIFLRSKEIVAIWKYLHNSENIIQTSLTVELAYKQFIKCVYEFLRDLYI